MYIYNCEYCKKTFTFNKRSQPGAHKTNCSLNPRREEILEKSRKSNPNLKQEKVLECQKCGSEYKILVSPRNFIKGNYKKNCSYKCSNVRILNDYTKSKISDTFKQKKLNKKINVIKEERNCLICSKKFECSKKSRKKYCSLKCIGTLGGRNSIQGKRSKNEILFYDLCKSKFEEVSNNENIFNGWDADIILHKEKIAILWNGVWHYKKIKESHSLEQVQNRDRIKLKEIRKCGYEPYVIKDMGKFNPNFVNQEFNIFLEKYKKAGGG